ncbi:MBL fold metallo-hydrolase [Brevibacillus composti]|uniref:MBL fold metallo-hydrolase n=1 Tax=Brevibacillus composti TaxID=2796470 RepID=A0A7T5JM79_9BACL|nr:MBL fold metallo-hydrolase [Brevibacillus composti]QQE72720.1 MBL fold metallo-hydrolase [Brevibacillus composti]QUO39798.1 MBL fold metallo-hydrolase [Brevibacillus composti]
MLWKAGRAWLLVMAVLILLLPGCSIDDHLQKTVKVEDPFASEDERDFIGLVIYYLELAHGESILIRLPSGKHMLVDTGSAEDWPRLFKELTDRRITRLEYVVLTNDQPEHAGGFAFLAERFPMEKVILPKLIELPIQKATMLRPGKHVQTVVDGDVVKLDSEVVMEVLHPSEPLFLSPQDNSLVFQLRHGELPFLFVSGINEKAEGRLLEKHKERLKAAVLKVADQGSNQATTQPFLSRVDPQVAVILTAQTKDESRLGQEEVLERLGESWAETYLTSQDGTIVIFSNGKDYRILKRKK